MSESEIDEIARARRKRKLERALERAKLIARLNPESRLRKYKGEPSKRKKDGQDSSSAVSAVHEPRRVVKSFFLSPDVMTKQAAAEKAVREQRAQAGLPQNKWRSWLFHAPDSEIHKLKGFDDRKSWLTAVIPLKVKALFEQARTSVDSAEGWPGSSPDPKWSIPTLRGHVYMLDESDLPQWFPTGPTLKFMNDQTANSVIRQFSNFPMERLHHYAMNGESLHALYTSRKLVDILIHVEKRLFYAHRIVLCTHSDYFANALLENDIPPYAITDTTLKSVDPQLFMRFLNFAYTGNIDIKLRELGDLKRLANMLQSKTLKAKLMLYMSMTGAMSLDQAMVIMCQEQEMDEKPIAIEVVKTNFKVVLDDPRMYFFKLEDFLDVISGDNACVRSELDIFWAVLFWVAYDYGNRVNHFPQLMNEVRFTCMTSLELMDCAKVTELIKLSNKCKKMLITANWVCHVRETGLEDPLGLPEQAPRTCLANTARDAPTVSEFDERFLRYTKLLSKREYELLNDPNQIQNTKINAKRVLFSEKDEYEPRFDDEDLEDYPSSKLLDDDHLNQDPSDVDSLPIPLTAMDSLDGISPGTTDNSEQGASTLSSLLTWGRDLIKPPSLNDPDGDDAQDNEQLETQNEKKARKKDGRTKEKEESSAQEEEKKESESEKADDPIPEEGEAKKSKKKKKGKSEKGGSPSPEEGEDKKYKKKKKGKSEKGGSPSPEEGEDKKSKKKKKGKSENGGSPSPEEGEDKKSKNKKKGKSKKGGSPSPEEGEDNKSKKKKKGKSEKGGSPSPEEGESKKSKKKSKRNKSGNWKKSHELDRIHLKSTLSGDRNENTVGEVDVALNNIEVAAAILLSEDSSNIKVCSKVIPDDPKSVRSVFRNFTVLKAAMKFKSKLRNKNQGGESKTEYDKISVNAMAFSEEADHRNTQTGLKTKVVARKPPVDVISLWESNAPQTQEIFLLGGSILQPVKQQKIVLTKRGDKTLQQPETTRSFHGEEPSQVDREKHSSLSAMEVSNKDLVEGWSPKSDIILSHVPCADSSSDIYPSSHTTSSSQCQLFSVLDCGLTSDASSLTLKDYESLESQSQVIKTDRGNRQCLDLKAGVPRPDHLESRTSDTFEITSSSAQYPQTSDQSFYQRPRRCQEYSLKSKLSEENPDQRLCGSQEYSLTSQLSGQIPYHQRRRHGHRRGDNSSTPKAKSYPHKADSYPHKADSYPHKADPYPHKAKSYPHKADPYPHKADSYPHNADSCPHEADSYPHKADSCPHEADSCPHTSEQRQNKNESGHLDKTCYNDR